MSAGDAAGRVCACSQCQTRPANAVLRLHMLEALVMVGRAPRRPGLEQPPGCTRVGMRRAAGRALGTVSHHSRSFSLSSRLE